MYLEDSLGSSRSSEGSTLVVANALAARQWEWQLGAARIAAGAGAWLAPPVLTYSSWLEALWLDADRQEALLTSSQALALWRQVIADSREGARLIAPEGVASWAAAGWLLMHQWRLEPTRQRSPHGQPDYQAFLGWCRGYRQRLVDNGWVDRAELEERLARSPIATADRFELTDLAETHPARTLLIERLEAAGVRLTERRVSGGGGIQRMARLADSADELRSALFWAQHQVAAQPSIRVAVVVAGLAERQAEVERELERIRSNGGTPAWHAGTSLAADPAIGAAFSALSLLGANTPYAAFGRWLRSPFFERAPGEDATCAQLDVELRSELRSQLPFATAYRRCGLAASLQQRAPQSAAALDAALNGPLHLERATPSRWAHVWSGYLTQLGWRPPATAPALLGWQAALDELVRLTPIVGEISIEAALEELRRVVERPAAPSPPIRGIHVLGHIADVGPGYAAAWVTGFTDSYWPEAPQGNPLLPRALQREHGMPRSTPQDAHERSRRALNRLIERVPSLVVSWPARVYDYETEASPAIRDWSPLATEELTAAVPARFERSSQAARESVADPPPRVQGEALPGGAGMLSRQARCPLRAFCQDRLGAFEMERLRLGVPGRLRGIAVHRAAEILYSQLPAQQDLASLLPRVEQAVDAALREVFRATRAPLRALFELEAEQLRELLTTFVMREQERGAFRVLAVEQRAEIRVGRWLLRARLDRLDEIVGRGVAVIDYKTGKHATSNDWFSPRLRDAQVPLYAVHSSESVAATVVARLRPAAAGYYGLWSDKAFPGRPNAPLAGNWASQLAHWQTQLETLAEEFASGDTRVFLDATDEAGGAYAPLTRVFEQVDLTRGLIGAW